MKKTLALVLCLALALVACMMPGLAEETSAYRTLYSGEITSLNYLTTTTENEFSVAANVIDTLVEYDRFGEVQPSLATSWEYDEANLTYTFHLREGAKWVRADGSVYADVTAHDFVSAAKYILDAANDSGTANIFYSVIAGAEAYYLGTSTPEEGQEPYPVMDWETVGVKALDDYTLEYTLTEPTPYFMTMLGYSIFAPMNRAYFLAQGGAFGVAEFAEAKEKATYTYGTGPDTIAYNGPFLITSFTEKNTMVFSANPTYYAPEKMGVHSLVWKFDDGTDATKTYNDMKAGDIDAAALNTSTMEIAKEDGLFDDYAAVSETDATSFVAWLNVNRKAYANYNDSTLGVSEQTDEMKELVRAAMLNVHFRRAVHYAIDRATANAQRRGEDLKYNSLINAYVPGNFVYLEHDVTVDINGTATTFPAGTAYGEIRQAQLEADGSHIKAFDAETGLGTGFDGWYNPEVAAKELAIAVEELKAQGYEITAENPVHLDLANYSGSEPFKNEGQAYKKSIEAALGGLVVVDIVPYETAQDWYDATYYPNTGAEMNYDIGTNGGWGPDYGDPKSYLDTMLPGGNGMTKSFGLF